MTSPEILLIDDDVYASVLRKRVLEHKGYRVQIALDGAAGLALAEAMKPSMVIFDHCFPGMSGLQLMVQLRKVLPYTPLISLSGHENLSDLYVIQPDAYMTKGDSLSNMFETIAALLP